MNYADKIKHLVTAKDLFECYGFKINAGGFCHSPFVANDKTASLKVYDGFRGWHDFSSGKGGDVIDFVREYFHLSFMDACKKINMDFALGLPIGEKISLNKWLEVKKEIARREKAIRERKNRHTELKKRYYDALDLWIQLDLMREKNKKELNDDYIYAVQNIDHAKYLVDIAEFELMEFEKR